MGQGSGGDRPNRGGDRKGANRKADDDTADEAEDQVQQALNEARDARDAGEFEAGGGEVARDGDTGDIDPTSIREEFGVDVTDANTRLSAETNGSYQTLTPEQRSQLKSSLTEKHGQEAVDSVYDQLESWKKGSGDMSVSQPYERLARDALGIEANVRGRGSQATEPTRKEIDVYRDLNRVSRAFLAANEDYGEHFQVHRGVRSLNASVLAAQAIDDPQRGEYYFPTSTISNHTTIEDDGREYSDGVMVSWDAEPDDIAMAIDHIFDTPRTEGELQAKGGVFAVSPEGMSQVPATKDDRKVSETAALMDTPSSLSQDEHDDVSNLVATVATNQIQLRTDAGKERVRGWLDEYQSLEGVSESKKRVAEKAVKAITGGSGQDSW